VPTAIDGPRTQTVALLAAIAVLTGTGAIAATGSVPGWEQAIFHAVNGLPDALRVPMWTFQLLGLLLVPALVGIVAAATRRWWLAACLFALIPVKLAAEHLVVKQLVHRERPASSICGLDL